MNILKQLKKEHREVEKLFKKMSKTTERSPKIRSKLLLKLELSLGAHAVAEEVVLYTKLKQEKKARQGTFEAYEEHGIAKRLLSELLTLSPADERWTGKMKVLSEVIEHHVKEEEEVLFKKVSSIFGEDELRELGFKYVAKRDQWISLHAKGLAARVVLRKKFTSLSRRARPAALARINGAQMVERLSRARHVTG
jgi:hemerythrin superfamily protein